MELIIVHTNGETFVQQLSPDKNIKWAYSDTNKVLTIDDNHAKKELLYAHNNYKSSPVEKIVLRNGSSKITISELISDDYIISYMRQLSEHLHFYYKKDE